MESTHPILGCAESVALEQELLGDDAEKIREAMTRAGRMMGQALMRDFREITELPERVRVLVLAGKGHNAGDALIAADELLRFHPYGEVHVLFAFGEEALAPLVREGWLALQEVGKTVLRSYDDLPAIREEAFDICLDGVFGMQFRAPLRQPLLDLFEVINTHSRLRMRAAVDLPSGVGEETDAGAFRADITYATGIAKRPLFEPANARFVGRVRYLDIGFFNQSEKPKLSDAAHGTCPQILLPDVLRPLQQMRSAQGHKYHYGHLFVLAGSRGMAGAAMMVVQAALRSGVGLVTACVPESVQVAFCARMPEAMWLPLPETPAGSLSEAALEVLCARLEKADALVIGPGMGRETETQALISNLLAHTKVPLVLDADALTPEAIRALDARESGAVCLTPHAGEFARINGSKPHPSDAQLLTFAQEHRVCLLLKGSLTRLTDGEHIIYSTFGGPILARGGSGDVLSGLLGGLLAQRPESPLLASLRAAAWHALAADALARAQGQHSALATDLFAHLPHVLRDYEC